MLICGCIKNLDNNDLFFKYHKDCINIIWKWGNKYDKFGLAKCNICLQKTFFLNITWAS